MGKIPYSPHTCQTEAQLWRRNLRGVVPAGRSALCWAFCRSLLNHLKQACLNTGRHKWRWVRWVRWVFPLRLDTRYGPETSSSIPRHAQHANNFPCIQKFQCHSFATSALLISRPNEPQTRACRNSQISCPLMLLELGQFSFFLPQHLPHTLRLAHQLRAAFCLVALTVGSLQLHRPLLAQAYKCWVKLHVIHPLCHGTIIRLRGWGIVLTAIGSRERPFLVPVGVGHLALSINRW